MGRKAQQSHGADDESGLTPKRAKNAVKVAKVVVPAAVPVLAPLVVRAAGVLREAYDQTQARRLGIDIGQLPEYRGRGGMLLSRIAGSAEGLTRLAAAERAGQDDRDFAQRSRGTLEQLTASVRAAERMPAARRKAAYRAVGRQLDQIEAETLRRLGVESPATDR